MVFYQERQRAAMLEPEGILSSAISRVTVANLGLRPRLNSCERRRSKSGGV